MRKLNLPPNTYGLWQATTEGDCEGRTIRDLGVHMGHFDEIALKLADKVYYTLQLKWVDPTAAKDFPQATQVQVSLSSDTGLQNLLPEERADAIKEWLAENKRSILVNPGVYYGAVGLVDHEAIERRFLEKKKKLAALNKLTREEIELLGLQDVYSQP